MPFSQTIAMRSHILQMFHPVCEAKERSPKARKYRAQSAQIVDEMFEELYVNLELETLMECGAHEATASRRFVKRAGTKAYAIEANPKVFEQRTNSQQDASVKALNVGLSDHEGTLDFHLPPDNDMAGNSSFHSRTGGTDPITVKTTTIDLLAAKYGIHNSLALWIDVEGYAFEVLSGGLLTLNNPNLKIIKLETEDVARWEGQKTTQDVVPMIERAGFVPIIGDIEYVHQFNVIYMRQADINDQHAVVEKYQARLENLSNTDLS